MVPLPDNPVVGININLQILVLDGSDYTPTIKDRCEKLKDDIFQAPSTPRRDKGLLKKYVSCPSTAS